MEDPSTPTRSFLELSRPKEERAKDRLVSVWAEL